MKDVKIKIIGVQGLDSDHETVELMTDGIYGERDGDFLLSYDESELIGQKGVKTTLLYKAPDTVVLQRFGSLRSRMVIQKATTVPCRYQTGFGEMMLDITGERVESTLGVSGGRLVMHYRIDAGGKAVSRNQVEITVKEG